MGMRMIFEGSTGVTGENLYNLELEGTICGTLLVWVYSSSLGMNQSNRQTHPPQPGKGTIPIPKHFNWAYIVMQLRHNHNSISH